MSVLSVFFRVCLCDAELLSVSVFCLWNLVLCVPGLWKTKAFRAPVLGIKGFYFR